jgi:hypothetical protein
LSAVFGRLSSPHPPHVVIWLAPTISSVALDVRGCFTRESFHLPLRRKWTEPCPQGLAASLYKTMHNSPGESWQLRSPSTNMYQNNKENTYSHYMESKFLKYTHRRQIMKTRKAGKI